MIMTMSRKQPGFDWLGRIVAPGCLIFVLSAGRLYGAEADVRRDSTVAAIEQVMPSVVNIATETIIQHHDYYEDLLRQFYGWPGVAPRSQRSISLGSGVIIDEDGYLLTNFHVVQRASRIQVKLWNGKEYEAEPKLARPGSDVALLKIKAKPGEKFKAIQFAQDDDLILGETVLALGNPFGLGGSVTKGILSSKNRRLSSDTEPLNVQDWLETDASINPGNSGGPLVNLRGELIGLNVAVAREQEGMGIGFSIPIKQVSASLSHFFTPEWTDSLWFGAELKAGPGPLLVTSLVPGSPAAKAGLREGDEIVRIDGQTVHGLIAANRLLCSATDHTSQLNVRFGHELRTLLVRLVPLKELIRQKLGCVLVELTATNAAKFGIQPGAGLLIEDVEQGGPADLARLQQGYLVTGIDSQKVAEIKQVAEILSSKKRGELARLSVVVPRRLGPNQIEYQQVVVEAQSR